MTWDLFVQSISNQWLSSLSVVLSALLGATIAIKSIRSAREITKKKSSIDVILQSKNDLNLSAGLGLIREIHSDPDDNIEKRAYSNHNSEDKDKIRYVLNYYEYIAIGIREGIYNEAIIKNSSHGTMVNVYKCCQPFILRVREDYKRDGIYCEFQHLYSRWEKSLPPNPEKISWWQFWK